MSGAEAVHARFGREGRDGFFNNRGFDELRVACCRQRLTNFLKTDLDNFFAGLFQEIVRRADDELKILLRARHGRIGLIGVKCGFVEDPLDICVQ